MKTIFFTVLLFCSFFLSNAQTQDLLLPYSSGFTLKISQGNSYCNNVYECTHYVNGNLEFAFDFAGGPESLNKPILAAANGTIVAAGDNGDWGKRIIIDYGNNEFGLYAHLNRIDLTEGTLVKQGQQIGLLGSTGNSTGPHLHYQTQLSSGKSISSTFLDSENISGIPKTGGLYTSLNNFNPYNDYRVGKFYNGWRIEPWGTSFNYSFIPFSRPFAITYYHEGGLDIGYPTENTHQATILELPGYISWQNINLPYIQNISNTSDSTNPWLTLVLNPYVYNIRMNYLGVVYPIHGRIRDYWRAYYSQLGPPVCNEYSETINGENYVVQWFEKDENNFVKVTYNINRGTFNDPKTNYLSYGNHLNQSTWDNLGCPAGSCGIGGDGTEPPLTDKYEFSEAKICSSIENDSPWNCTEEKNIFFNNSAKVYSWVEILNLYEPIDLSWVYLYPSGDIASEGEWDTQNPNDEGQSHYEWWHDNYWVDFTGSSIFGTYTIKFYINNTLVGTSYFELKESSGLLLPPTELEIN